MAILSNNEIIMYSLMYLFPRRWQKFPIKSQTLYSAHTNRKSALNVSHAEILSYHE